MNRGTVVVASADRLYGDVAGAYLSDRGWDVVAVARDGMQALAITARWRPRALLVIGDVERVGPAPLAMHARRRWPEMQVVILGEAAAPEARVLPLSARPADVVDALDAAPEAMPPARPEKATAGVALLQTLTTRERRVMRLLARGTSAAAIAAELGVSGHTVRTHIQNLYVKLRCHSRLDVVLFAARHGILPDDEWQDPPLIAP